MIDPTYRFCPCCATPLEAREIYGLVRPSCPACDFIYFRDPKVAVIGLVTSGPQVLLVQRAINPEKGKWALPGGYMDAGEMPQDALRRELMEEVNLPIRVTDLLTIFPMITNRAVAVPEKNTTAEDSMATARITDSPGIVLAFRAEVADPSVTALCCDDDVSAAGWFGRDELPTELAFSSTRHLLAEWIEHL